jgi:glycosyltransferase involved in cell wall biosynthesis
MMTKQIMEQKTVTVWCLTYNQRDFIRDALDGFVMQKTTFPFEVVVHDDASSDGTTDIVLEYARRYPNIIYPMIEKENQWKKGGLKKIISIMNENHCHSKYIAFCEGDDYWIDPLKLQKQVTFLDYNPDYSMCFHSAKKKYETDTIAWIDCENIEERDYDPTDIFVNWTIPTASVLCRKDGLDYYARLKHLDKIQNYDIFIFLSCAMVGKLRGMNEQMSVYRIQGEGLTYNKNALIRCTMNNPDHFITLKENFPIVDPKPVNDTISKVFFERALIKDGLSGILHDLFMSFLYSPIKFFKMCFSHLLIVIHKMKAYEAEN